jgi:heme-degrading monooxygenase HmoA
MDQFATTPELPYYAVVFTSQRTAGDVDNYSTTSHRMLQLAAEQPGFLGAESARDAQGLGITVSYWESLAAIAAWRQQVDHRLAQRDGRGKWYERFQVRVCRVERQYEFTRSVDDERGRDSVMDKHELLAELKSLRAELEKSESIDPQALQRLSVITEELESRENAPQETQDSEETEAYGLRDLLVRFEAEHPQLSETLGRIADGLARMGI